MKSIGSRRLGYCVQLSLGIATALGLAHCGGGERPPSAIDDTPALPDAGPSGAVTIGGYEPETGIIFGDNGFTNCGAQATNKTIILKNPTPDVIDYTATLSAGATFYKVTPDTGGIPAKGQVLVQIAPQPIPQKSDVSADLYAGTLEVQLTTGEPPTIIRLHQTARGAIIKTTVLEDKLEFGDVKVNSSSAKQVSFTNSGNLEVTANFQLGTPQFQIDQASVGTVKIPGGETVSKSISFGPNTVKDEYTDTLAVGFNTSAVHCEPPPGNVSLKGNGTSSVTVSPGLLNFGQVDCGTTAPFQTITINSTSNMSFTPTLGAGGLSKFTLASGSGTVVTPGNPISLAANTDYVMRIVPKPVTIPSVVAVNGLGDKLTITTNVALDPPHVVDLQETARGSIFAFGQAGITHSGSINQTANNTLTVVNSGNAPGAYTVTVTARDGDPSPPSAGTLATTFNSTLTTGTAQVGTTAGTLISTTPGTFNTSILGALSLTSGAILCQDLPAKMPIAAQTGAGTSITTDKAGLDFGLVDCGATGTFQTVTITSIVTTTVTPNLIKGTGSLFSLADNTGAALALGNAINLTAGVPYVMRIVPKLIPVPSSTVSNAVGDSLTLASSVDPLKTITLNQTARGAVFGFSAPSISPAPGTYPLTLSNTGNGASNWSIAITGGTTSLVSGSLPGPGSVVGSVTRGTAAGAITLSVPPGSVLCGVLPPDVVIPAAPM